MMPDLLTQLDQIPPCVARLCARAKGRAKTLKEIKNLSGLSYRKVNWISRLPSWGRVKLADALRFSAACDVDLLRPRKKLFYLRRAFSHPKSIDTLGRGLPRGYVVRQIKILEQHEKSRRAIAQRGGV